MKRTGPTNEHVARLITDLNRTSAVEGAPIWRRVAEDLALPTRSRRIVNLSRLKHVVGSNETVVVPGKVLGNGAIPSKVTVAALSFSKSAEARIHESQGKCVTIEQLLKANPKGNNLRIIG